MRRIAALVVAAGVLVTVAACSSTPSRAGCGPAFTDGAASTTITATGDFGGTTTTASFPTPLVATKPQVTVLSAGTGPLVEKGDYAEFVVTEYDAKTGESHGSTPASYVADDESDLSKVFECVNVGSRVAAVVPTSSGTYAFVFDITHEFKGKATGTEQLPVSGMPQVVTAPDGTPGITVANLPVPTSVKSAVTKAGSGAVVKAGDTVVLKYTVFAWSETTDKDGVVTHEATVGKTNWGDIATTGGPVTATAGTFDATQKTGFFPGTEAALENQKVGSQVVVVVPPKFSYASSADAGDNVPENTARVYVIDILDVKAATQ